MRRAARRVVPASGPRHHDDSRHLIASITCRRTPLPVPQPRCRIAAKHPSRAAHLAKIALSKTAAPSLRPLQSVSHGRLRRPTHRSQRPPGRQIAIDGNPHAAHRGFLPWRLSDAGPQCPLLDCERAGIRNPSHEDQFPPCQLNARCVFREETFAEARANGRDAPKADFRAVIVRPCCSGSD